MQSLGRGNPTAFDCDDEEFLKEELKKWALLFDVRHNQLDALLKILIDTGHILPRSARTLLGTQRVVETQKIGKGEYYYFGSSSILHNFLRYPNEIRDGLIPPLKLQLNVDGVPLFNSSTRGFWPILATFSNLEPSLVFPLAILSLEGKPETREFLKEAVEDLKTILSEGLFDGVKTIPVVLQAVICDAPARAMVKETKQFQNSYYGCDLCSQPGEFVNRRMTFPEVHDLTLRTNESFRARVDKIHQPNDIVSVFCELNVDMVLDFPIDYMHSVCLGVVKRMIEFWTHGIAHIKRAALSAGQKHIINQNLEKLKRHVPSCFARKPRTLTDVPRWKATEFRTFLLYTGPVVLDGILSEKYYDHFMLLSLGISILICPSLSKTDADFAGALLKKFVSDCPLIYCPEFVVYNVHSLVHLSALVKRHGCLDSFSAFKFENHLQTIKKMVRTTTKPLAQVVKRSSEHASLPVNLTMKTKTISERAPDNVFIVSSGRKELCVEVCQYHPRRQLCVCTVYGRSHNFFKSSELPCSQYRAVHVINSNDTHIGTFHIASLTKQAMKLPLSNNKCVVMGILHDI